MALDAQVAIEQLDAILAEIEPHTIQTGSGEWVRLPETKAREMRTRAMATIERLAPSGGPHVRQARTLDAGKQHDEWLLVRFAGVLRALRADYEAGYTRTVEELIHGDLFSDFLEMADELLSKKYKDAAAVIAGSVLEEHLRQLAAKNGVPTTTPEGKPLQADRLNADLTKAGAYNKIDQKGITAWLGIRNDAAHGHYANYDQSQVEALTRDVRSFLARHPA